MSFPSTGIVKFSAVKTYFGGTTSVVLSKYYTNNASGFTTGISGLPLSTALFKISYFYGKTKGTVVPTPVETNMASGTFYSNPRGVAYSTSYEVINGAAFTNTSRTGVSQINNIGSQGTGAAGQTNRQNLIIQARVGDVITIQIGVTTIGGYNEVQECWVNYGSGYVNIFSTTTFINGSGSVSFNYTIPAGTANGNFAFMCSNNYSTAGNRYQSAIYYSLQVF